MAEAKKKTTNDLRDVAYEVAANINKDFDIAFVRRMENLTVQGRAVALRQEYEKKGRLPASSEYTINVYMKEVPPAECLQDEVKCTVFRTIDKIPKPIRKGDNPVPFAFVGSTNQEVSFIFVRPEEVRSILEGTRFIKAKPLYAYYNEYVYTFNHDAGRITIRDSFSDPRELLVLQGCDKQPCIAGIELEEDMKRLIKMFMYEELRQFNVAPTDKQVRLNETQGL